MTRHRYPLPALLGDYARACLGLALTALPLALVPMNPVVAAIFAGLALLFAVFALSTARRQLSVVELDESGIGQSGARPIRIDWQSLDAVALRWFASRRDRSSGSGFMQLVLKGGGKRLSVDSRIEDFTALADAAAAAARRRHLPLGEATAANFMALGIRVEE
jgi:hypothetical protein